MSESTIKSVLNLLAFFMLITMNLTAQSLDLNLTSKESEWLAEHPVIRVSHNSIIEIIRILHKSMDVSMRFDLN